jgi:hypothetical protein
MEVETKNAVSLLLKNISDGLSVLSISELNQAISEILIKKKEKTKDLELLYDVVCNEFSVTRKSLKEKYTRGNISTAKTILYVIMNKHLGMSKRSIAISFSAYPNSVNVAVNYFDNLNPEKIKPDNIFYQSYQKCLTKFLQKIS